MKRASKLSLATLLITVLMIVDAPSASACTCTGGLPLINQIASSAAIFSGKVTEFTSLDATSSTLEPPFNGIHASVEVIQVWKGPASETLTVVSSGCGYSFEVGTEYLIFAY